MLKAKRKGDKIRRLVIVIVPAIFGLIIFRSLALAVFDKPLLRETALLLRETALSLDKVLSYLMALCIVSEIEEKKIQFLYQCKSLLFLLKPIISSI